ncbi:putative membrane metal-binding protein [Pseudorhizobium tarimense]|uniref:Membrane metal-binding protein n=1 Tax=Pseudorhizobium tarimense TaxID=1079109 RepID=A0ABV2HA82_9HYPH|nr:hypothetical protein [Pseudorhizobium tarimense]MCJ8520546.1 hypothetical protein [Pseudorhizobium tarimense]
MSPPSGPALPGLNDFAFSAFFDRIGAVGFLYGAPAQIEAPELSWYEQKKPPPDILISDDGALVALVGPAAATNRARPPSFICDQWQRAHWLATPLPSAVSPGGDGPLLPKDR